MLLASSGFGKENHLHMFKGFLTAGVAGLLALGLFAPAALAQEAPATGTLTGIVTWGPDASPAAFTMVGIEGTSITAQTDAQGKFVIGGVPVGPSYTIDAYSDPMQSVVATRYNVTVSPGEQLDIGALNLSVSPQEGTPPMEVLPNPDFGNYNTA
jgi:hypothetical protein